MCVWVCVCVLLLLLFIWWLSKPPNVSALLGRQTGPTLPSVWPARALQPAPPTPLLTKACRLSTAHTGKIQYYTHTQHFTTTKYAIWYNPCSPSLRASFMIGSPFVTSSDVALNNIRSLTGGFISSGAEIQSLSSLKMCTFSSNKEMICSSFLRRSSEIKHEQIYECPITTAQLQQQPTQDIRLHA